MGMKYTHKIALIVLIIGGLNWGLYGLVSIDLVDMIFGGVPLIARLIYVFVGLSALYIAIESFKGGCTCCKESCCGHDKCDSCCAQGKCHDENCNVENKGKEEIVAEENK